MWTTRAIWLLWHFSWRCFFCPKYLALQKFPFQNRFLNKWAYMNERETKSMERYGEAVFATEYLCKEYRHTVALRDVSARADLRSDRRKRRGENHPAANSMRSDSPHTGQTATIWCGRCCPTVRNAASDGVPCGRPCLVRGSDRMAKPESAVPAARVK